MEQPLQEAAQFLGLQAPPNLVSQTSAGPCWHSLPPGAPATKQGPCTLLSHRHGHRTVKKKTHIGMTGM